MRLLGPLAAVGIVAGLAAAVYGVACSRAPESPARQEAPARPIVTTERSESAIVALGRQLFYDRGLSFNNTTACATCHRQEFAFSDPRPRSLGATGDPTRRNAMTLTNVASNARFNWANNSLKALETQALIPLLDEHPLEMGLRRNEPEVMQRLRRHATLFEAAFAGDGDAITLDHVVKALSAFQRTLISNRSPYDRFVAGDSTAFGDPARRGMTLFRSTELACTRCHDGDNFRMTPGHRTSRDDDSVAYHNVGLYNVDGAGAYPADDTGLMMVTGVPEDMGRFKAPTLRNIAVTGPYMHDGSVPTLEEVIAIFAAGGRNVTSGPHAGDGRANPHKSPLIKGFAITPVETRDLVAFLDSLTDTAFLTNPAFSEP